MVDVTYCEPTDHDWVAVTNGQAHDPDYDTIQCVNCGCHSSVRKPDAFKQWATVKRAEVYAARPTEQANPATMIGRR